MDPSTGLLGFAVTGSDCFRAGDGALNAACTLYYPGREPPVSHSLYFAASKPVLVCKS